MYNKEKIIVDRDTLTSIIVKWEEFETDLEGNVYNVDFEIYDISWVSYNGKTGEREYPCYHDLEDYNNIQSDHKPSEETKPKIRGHIKWDGCCNYEYNEKPMHHMCGLSDFKREFEQIGKAYNIAAEIMGNTADLEMMGLDGEI